MSSVYVSCYLSMLSVLLVGSEGFNFLGFYMKYNQETKSLKPFGGVQKSAEHVFFSCNRRWLGRRIIPSSTITRSPLGPRLPIKLRSLGFRVWGLGF